MSRFRKGIIFLLVLALVSAFSINTGFARGYPKHGHYERAKNVIILIPDGCSQSIQTLARWYTLVKEGKGLAVDEIQVGVVKHEMADSVITDSTAAATAFATGYKTSNGFLSVGPRKTQSSLPIYGRKTLQPFLTNRWPRSWKALNWKVWPPASLSPAGSPTQRPRHGPVTITSVMLKKK